MEDLVIRKATRDDRDGVWEIIQAVISTGESYAFRPDTPRNELIGYWFHSSVNTYIAESSGKIVGTFIIKDNQPGLGAHVANASFMTSPSSAGRGIGTSMGRFSLIEAKRLGYKSMQFNLVVKSNETAVRLWQRLGFEIIGEIPDAFDHKLFGLTNAFIMYRKL